jgi:hypothetical protein
MSGPYRGKNMLKNFGKRLYSKEREARISSSLLNIGNQLPKLLTDFYQYMDKALSHVHVLFVSLFGIPIVQSISHFFGH